MKTYSAKPADINRKWYVLDASKIPMGRLATQAATLLTGKGKPQFTHHIDTGDYVIVINAAALVATGNKLNAKVYQRHSGYPSGLTTITLKDQIAKDPTVPIFKAVRGMLPVNKLRAERLKRLKIYADENHQHEAQKPEQLSMKAGK
ncbi:MAG TPA: 50S ribosomal protein L13 [Candidatus Limnocylindrales bacterium]|nr:50S ribosomal protein L13 [Candidatus Limnocylindrales bacterium]